MTISRRNFARLAATSGAVAVASPAIAQGAIKWRLASSIPKSIEGLWGAGPTLAKYVNEITRPKLAGAVAELHGGFFVWPVIRRPRPALF